MIDLLAIVGQTATGKTALSLRVAQSIPSEIIAGDSKTIYKTLDIGTAKPSKSDQKLVKHHLIDVVEPNETFNVYQFQTLASRAIQQIHGQSKLPILVGGSGLYMDSILNDYQFEGGEVSEQDRQALNQLTTPQLQQRIQKLNLTMPENNQNRRYLLRTLERGQVQQTSLNRRANTLIIGLHLNREVLSQRIQLRLTEMLNQGVLEEVQRVLQMPEVQPEVLTSNIYRAFKPYFEQKITFQEACSDFIRRDLTLAKKQWTWFKRYPDISWFESSDLAYNYIVRQLNVKK
ncbi:MAG: tRNA (adenosine(37)-N6)-dimethylallyltransferase MiaA [Candidatus Saccharibacteria bacterium]|nr:tRNA (adenosine(37)-N6)-dimethylallyltransferase MiaA [Candidatus Saccharibacteria bacterium]